MLDRRIPIAGTRRFHVVEPVYGSFQHRSCLTGPFEWLCTGWKWTRVSAQLNRGSVTWD